MASIEATNNNTSNITGSFPCEDDDFESVAVSYAIITILLFVVILACCFQDRRTVYVITRDNFLRNPDVSIRRQHNLGGTLGLITLNEYYEDDAHAARVLATIKLSHFEAFLIVEEWNANAGGGIHKKPDDAVEIATEGRHSPTHSESTISAETPSCTQTLESLSDCAPSRQSHSDITHSESHFSSKERKINDCSATCDESNIRNDSAETSDNCAICCNNFLDRELVCRSNNSDCQHIFHKACLHSWFRASCNFQCPTCRRMYVIDEEQQPAV